MTDIPVLNPVKLLRENISKIEVAKYYLEIEFSKLFKNVDVKLINETIDSLNISDGDKLLREINELNGFVNFQTTSSQPSESVSSTGSA